MNHGKISRDLALAIGYLPRHVRCNRRGVCQVWRIQAPFGFTWVTFDYRRPDVIWPIAEKYNAFPTQSRKGMSWYCSVYGEHGRTLHEAWATTAAIAVAYGVIGATKRAVIKS